MIIINGVKYSGNSITVNNGKIVIDDRFYDINKEEFL